MKLPNKPFIILTLFLFFCFIQAQQPSIEIVVQTGHYSEVTCVAFNTDGNLAATGSNDKTIKLWRIGDGKEISALTGSGSSIEMLAFNKTSTLVTAVNKDGEILVWDINNGNLTSTLKLEDDDYSCVAFLPDGNCIIAGTEKSGVSQWDIKTGKKIKEFVAEQDTGDKFKYLQSRTVSISNDGKYLAAGTENYVTIVWDIETGKETGKYKKTKNTCYGCLTNAVLTSDSKQIVTAYSDTVKVFDRVTGKLINKFSDRSGSYESLAISPDDKMVAAVQYGAVHIWDLKSGKLINTIKKEPDRITCIAFHPDGKRILAGNEKRTSDVFDIKSGKKLLTLKGFLNHVDERVLSNSYMYWAALVNETKLSPDSKYVAVGRCGNVARILDFKTGKTIKTLKGHTGMVVSLNFSKDGKYLATGGIDGRVILWDVETGKAIHQYRYRDTSLAIFSIDISPDNKYVATADWAGYVALWDIKTGKYIKALSPHNGSASYHIKFSANGLYIISAGLDRKLVLTEIDTGEEIREFKGHTDIISSVNYHPILDRFITCGYDNSIRVWDFYSGLQVMKIEAHQGGALSAKFDKSGDYIISGGNDNLVKMWDAKTGNLLAGFKGHRGAVGEVNITNDNKFIISGGRDGAIRIWDVEKQQELVSQVFINENDWFVKTPQGYFDASEGAFKEISFVKGTELYSIDQFFNEFYKPGLYYQALFGENSGMRENIIKNIDDYPPPSVEFVAPASHGPVEDKNVVFFVKVSNNGGGVSEFKVLHNGKRLNVDDSDLKHMKKEGQYVIKNFEVDLLPGENEISVSAFSDGDIESAPKKMDLYFKGTPKTSNCYVMSIGINKYENENLNLNYARPDAEAFAKLVGNKGENLFNKTNVFKLLDKDASRTNILQTLDKIATEIKPEDVFIFFYAGHGSMVDNEFYFITTENTGLYQADKLKNAIKTNELHEKFKGLKALKQVVFIDACHSGSSIDALAMRGAGEEKALAQLSRSSGIHVMASSESQQQAAEISNLGHGVFTYVVLQALEGKADGAPRDSKITVYEIKSYIDDQVPEISYELIKHKQFPSTFSMGHDFPLVLE